MTRKSDARLQREAAAASDASLSTTTVSPEALRSLQMFDLQLRALRAEHALTAERLGSAEKETQAFLDRMKIELEENGKYELVGGVDAKTGAVQRRLVTPA